MAHPVHQQGPIRQIGQRIVIRDVLQVRVLLAQGLFHLLPLSDVLHSTDHADRLALVVPQHFRVFVHDADGAVERTR
jgi:hypothetical protein